MRKPGRGQILENRLVGPREVLGGGDRRVPAKGRGRTAPCRGRSGASWIWATPLTPARARGSSVRATPSLRPPRILKTSLFLQKGGPRKEPSQRTATALFYLIPCGDFQLSPREFYLSLIIYYTYDAYPWDFSGEIVELLLGMGFLLALLPAARTQGSRRKLPGQLLPPLATWGMVVVLGSSSPALTRLFKPVYPELIETARVELKALSQDFVTMFRLGRVRPTSCGLNKRVYTVLVQFNQSYLRKGAYSRLRSQGLPAARADFFIDPWNSPYWIQHDCSERSGGELVMVYSFGPNHRRESTEWEVGGDDIAAIIEYRSSASPEVPEGR